MAIFIQAGDRANDSEHEFFKMATTELPDDWLVIANPLLYGKNREKELDAIILGPGTLLGIEIKCWKGKIKADSGGWQRENGLVMRSPVQQITMACRRYFAEHGKLLKVSFQGLVVMMAGSEKDLSLTSHEKDRVVWKRNAVSRFISTSTKMKLDTDAVKVFLKAVAGERGIYAWQSGGDILPEKPGARLRLILQQGNFFRSYSGRELSRLFLGKDELRGSQPDHWRSWWAEGVYINFGQERITLEPLPGVEVRINGELIPVGFANPISVAQGKLDIGGIQMQYTIEPDEG